MFCTKRKKSALVGATDLHPRAGGLAPRTGKLQYVKKRDSMLGRPWPDRNGPLFYGHNGPLYGLTQTARDATGVKLAT